MPFAGILFTIFTIFSIIIFKKDEEYGGATMFAGVTITLLYMLIAFLATPREVVISYEQPVCSVDNQAEKEGIFILGFGLSWSKKEYSMFEILDDGTKKKKYIPEYKTFIHDDGTSPMLIGYSRKRFGSFFGIGSHPGKIFRYDLYIPKNTIIDESKY